MRYIGFLTVALALSGCADVMTSPARLADQADEISKVTPTDQIVLTSADTINDGNFTQIAAIEKSIGKATIFGKTPTVADGELKLRIEGAELGADAVINKRISNVGVCALSWGCRTVSGTAVKYSN
ncbi:hypothetical protein [Roseobacter sp.]|uniref:hypothetical protein n=1 Tax=Roseobacter sp. TaxID=1907202 RepID=UPI0032998E70